MREFYLYVNDTTYDLNGGKILFVDPTGLGVNFNNTIADLGDGFSVLTKRKQKLGQVVGKLVFFRDGTTTPYLAYTNFVASLKGKDIVLGYNPYGVLYRANVEISYITKTESHDSQYIEIPVAFDLKTQWYTKETATFTRSKAFVANGDSIAFEIQLTSANGKFKVTTTESNVVTQEVDVDVSSLGLTKIVYSNVPNDCKIVSVDGIDLSQYITSIEHPEKIFHRPSGIYTVTITNEAGTGITGTINAFNYRRTA